MQRCAAEILERLLTWGRGGLCRAGLHLQLTTELITGAAAAGAEGAATESMWQRSGALAVQCTTAWALELLAALSGCGPGHASGEAIACPHPHCICSLQGSAVGDACWNCACIHRMQGVWACTCA